jgi:O-antigen ligase
MSSPGEWSIKLSQILKWLFASLFFLLPLVLWPKTSELFEFNKMLLVYVFAVLIGGAYLTRAVVDRRLTLTKTPLDLGLGLFLISQILATAASINFHTSLWGYYSRFHGGLASTFAYILLFYVLSSLLNESKQKERQSSLKLYLYAILSSGVLVAAYGVLERLGIDKHLWIQDVQNRVFSTLGQPNWLSAYLAALLPLPIYLSSLEGKSRLRWFWGAVAVLFFTTILFTRSRSGIATTFIILALVAAQQVWQKLKQKRPSKTPWLVLTAILVVTLTFGSPWTPNPGDISRRLDLGGPLWAETEGWLNRINLTTQIKPLEVDRLPQETQELIIRRESGERIGGSSSMEIRRVVWQGAWRLFRMRPWFGTGVETFAYSYYWTRPAAHNLLSEWDFLYNKAHNEYLNLLATTGIVGLTAYLLLLASMLRLYLISWRAGNKLAFPLLVGFISILITNFFGFSVVAVALLFFLFPALVMFTGDKTYPVRGWGPGWNLSKKQVKQGQYQLNSGQYLLIVLIIFTALWGLSGIYRIWRSDILYNGGKIYHQAGYLLQAADRLESAVQLNSNEAVFHSQLAEAYADIALALHQQTISEETVSAENLNHIERQRDSYANKALVSAQRAISLNPWHLNLLKSKAKVELTLSLYDPSFMEDALATLIRANELAPTDAKIIYNIGLIYETQGRADLARQAYEKSLELKGDYIQVKAELDRLDANSD